MKKCIIIGAGDFNALCPDYTADFIIAADGGYEKLTEGSVDLLVGDFDSIKAFEIPHNVETIRFPSEKVSSDLELAVNEAINRGFDCFYIYGALGGRLDHTFGSIAVLTAISKKGMTGYLIGENEIITAVTNSKLELTGNGIISIFPAGEKAQGVTLEGLKYELNNAELTCCTTHGLSNEYITGKSASIQVRDGTLIVIIQKSADTD